MKRFGIIFFITFILAVAGVLAFSFLGAGEASKQGYRLASVEKGNVKAIVSSTGTLNPINTVKVGSQVSGIIKEIYADFNSPVKKDQVIALIDPAFYEAQLEQAKAQLLIAKANLQESHKSITAAEAGVESAEAQLASAQATLKEAELKYNRLSSLENGAIVAESDLDTALAKRDNSQAAVGMAEAQLRSAKANLKRVMAQEKGSKALIEQRKASLNLAEIQLKYCTITSPINGVVIERHVDVGQTVAASLQSPTLFTIAEDLSSMQVEADVSEADVGQIAPGQEVEFTVDAFPEQKFKANVRQVRNSATSIQNVVTYKIIADVKNESMLLRPGMTANVNIIVADVSDVLKVPNAAFRFKPPGEVKEASGQRIPPVRQRETFKYTVEKLVLRPDQIDEYEKIVQAADSKLKQAYTLPEGERDLPLAWRNYFTEILKNLYQVLTPDQYGKFREYVEEAKTFWEKRKQSKLRRVKLYILDEAGQPEAVNVMAGISDDNQTQIVSEEIKEGEQVITGLILNGKNKKKKSNIFSSIMRRGR